MKFKNRVYDERCYRRGMNCDMITHLKYNADLIILLGVMLAKNAILYKICKNISTRTKQNYFSFGYHRHVISCTFYSIVIY